MSVLKCSLVLLEDGLVFLEHGLVLREWRRFLAVFDLVRGVNSLALRGRDSECSGRGTAG